MPITDKDIADLCVGIYTYPGSPPVGWDRFDDGEDSDQICWGVKVIDGCDVVVFRGSTTFEDWRRDFDVWANPFVHSKLGPVHPGFLLGLDQVLEEYRQKGSGKLMVVGHSLGAGRASIFCGLAIVAGIVPVGRVVFGEPRPGFQPLAGLLASIKEMKLPQRQVRDLRARLRDRRTVSHRAAPIRSPDAADRRFCPAAAR